MLSTTRGPALLIALLASSPAGAQEPAPEAAERELLPEPLSPPAPTPGHDLAALLQAAEAHSPLLKAAGEELAAAEALHRKALWAWLTPISVTASASAPTPEARTLGGDFTRVTAASLTGNGDLGEWGASLRWEISGAIPLYTFGKLSAAQDAAQQGVAAMAAKRDATGAELLAKVEQAYLGLGLARELIGLADEGIGRAEDALARAEQLMQDPANDQVTQNDVFMLRYLRGELQARRLQAVTATRQLARALYTLTGLPASTPIASAPIVPIGPPPRTLAELQAWADAHRPELRMARAGEAAMGHLERLQWGRFFPDVVLGGFARQAWTSSADDQRNPFVRDDYNYLEAGAGLGLRYTLDLGDKLASYDKARAEHGHARFRRDWAEQGIALEVATLYETWLSLDERLARHREAAEAARSWVVAAALNFETGLAGAADLLDAIVAWGAARGGEAEATYRLQVLRCDLRRAIGQHPLAAGPLAVALNGVAPATSNAQAGAPTPALPGDDDDALTERPPAPGPQVPDVDR